MIKTVTCIVVECDTCGAGGADDENGSWHFDTIDSAYRELVITRTPGPDPDPDEDRRWQIEDGKPILCADCRLALLCSLEGHVWSEWGSVRGRGMFESRCCWRCSKFESNIDALVDQMVAEVNPS